MWQYKAAGIRRPLTGLPPQFVSSQEEVRICADKVFDIRRIVTMVGSMYDEVLAENDLMPVVEPKQTVYTKFIGTWKIRFDGTPTGLHIDELVFIVGTQALSSRFSLNMLAKNIHYLRTGKASNWFWVHLRNNPSMDWQSLKAALIDQFAEEECDADIRKLIQCPKTITARNVL